MYVSRKYQCEAMVRFYMSLSAMPPAFKCRPCNRHEKPYEVPGTLYATHKVPTQSSYSTKSGVVCLHGGAEGEIRLERSCNICMYGHHI